MSLESETPESSVTCNSQFDIKSSLPNDHKYESILEDPLADFRIKPTSISKQPRTFFSKRMEGFNAEVYSTWIERWARNSAINYPIVKRAVGVELLRKAAKDVPCFVVGIGPSLDDNIKYLESARFYGIIIATDAALRPLLRRGIKPDLVVNYDCRDHQKTMWDTIDTSDLVLLANSCTSPKTIDAWKGKIMFFNMMQSDDEFASNVLPAMYPDLGQLPNLGTVGNGAVFLAWQMGCKSILTIGMDLCYQMVIKPASNEEPTAKDAILGGRWRYRCKDWLFMAPTQEFPEGQWIETENKALYDNSERMKETQDELIKGFVYKTDKVLQFYRNSLVSNVGQFDMPVINCSGGATEKMLRSMPLQKAMEGKEPMSQGQSIVRHLFSIIPDCKNEGDSEDQSYRCWKKTWGGE